MPKYYFDLLGREIMRDRAGIDLSSDAAATREAILRGTDRLHPDAPLYSEFESIQVRGSSGSIICAAPIRYSKRLPQFPQRL